MICTQCNRGDLLEGDFPKKRVGQALYINQPCRWCRRLYQRHRGQRLREADPEGMRVAHRLYSRGWRARRKKLPEKKATRQVIQHLRTDPAKHPWRTPIFATENWRSE